MKDEEGIVKQLGMLPKYGLIGVMFGLMLLAGLAMWMTWKQASNHIDHNTEALGKVSDAVFENAKTTAKLQTFLEVKLR